MTNFSIILTKILEIGLENCHFKIMFNQFHFFQFIKTDHCENDQFFDHFDQNIGNWFGKLVVLRPCQIESISFNSQKWTMMKMAIFPNHWTKIGAGVCRFELLVILENELNFQARRKIECKNQRDETIIKSGGRIFTTFCPCRCHVSVCLLFMSVVYCLFARFIIAGHFLFLPRHQHSPINIQSISQG